MRALIAMLFIGGSIIFAADESVAPRVGETVPTAAIEQMQGNSHVLIMASPSQFYRLFVFSGDVRWELGVSDDGKVKYVSTKETRRGERWLSSVSLGV